MAAWKGTLACLLMPGLGPAEGRACCIVPRFPPQQRAEHAVLCLISSPKQKAKHVIVLWTIPPSREQIMLHYALFPTAGPSILPGLSFLNHPYACASLDGLECLGEVGLELGEPGACLAAI